jgi:ABC-type transporter MlaC component
MWLGFLLILALHMAQSNALAAQIDCPNANVAKAAAASFTGAAQVGTPDAFAAAISRHTDINELALSALGRYRKDLQPAHRQEYVRNTRAFMGRFLAKYANRFARAQLAIEGCSGNLVRSRAGGHQILWRISGGRVRDVRVGNVWLAASMRAKFASVIRRGKSIDALLTYLAQQHTTS